MKCIQSVQRKTSSGAFLAHDFHVLYLSHVFFFALWRAEIVRKRNNPPINQSDYCALDSSFLSLFVMFVPPHDVESSSA